MPTVLLVFEFLGTTELMVIALVALIIFGPRKLPEIGRSLGRSMGEFKRASDDFKRTWEYEVELENRKTTAVVADTGEARGELTGGESPDDDATVTEATAAADEAAGGEDAGSGIGDVSAADDVGNDGAQADGVRVDEIQAGDVSGGRDEGRSIARGEDGPDAS